MDLTNEMEDYHIVDQEHLFHPQNSDEQIEQQESNGTSIFN